MNCGVSVERLAYGSSTCLNVKFEKRDWVGKYRKKRKRRKGSEGRKKKGGRGEEEQIYTVILFPVLERMKLKGWRFESHLWQYPLQSSLSSSVNELLFTCSVLSDSAAHQASLSFTISQSLLKLLSIELVMPSNHLILCCSLLPSVFPNISNELILCIRWSKYWSFTFSISPSNEYSGLTSFRIDWFDLLVVQGTLKSLLQKERYR